MATEILSPVDKPRNHTPISDEKAPLLPKHSDTGICYDEFNGGSFAGAVFNLSTTTVGAGIMALPATMKVMGLVPGLVMIVLVAFLTEKSVEMLIRFSRAAKVSSYGGVMGDAFGRAGSVLLLLCIVVNNLGVAIVYMIIIGDVVSGTSSGGMHHSGVLEGWFGEHWWSGRFFVILATTLVIFAPLACYRRVVHTIDSELEDPSQMKPIVRTSLALCSTVYITTSFFGFLLFGNSTLPDVLANFDADLGIPDSSLLADAVRVCYAIHLMLVFPIIFHALRLNLDSLLFHSAKPLYSDNWRFSIMSAVLLVLIFMAANFIPSIWDAFQFTGATAGVCIGFIFPAAIALRDSHGIAARKDKFLAVFMIVLAVLSNAVAIYSDAYSLFHKMKVVAQS